MKPYAAETSTLQRLWKLPMTEVIGVERRASLAAEDKVRASVGGLEGPKGLLEGRRHVDGAPGPSGLESADCAVPERPSDVNLVFGEVDVVPLKPKELTLTHPGEDRHQEQRRSGSACASSSWRISSGVRTSISLSSPRGRSTYCTGLASRYPHWTACLNISFMTTITLPMVLGDKPLASNVLMNS